MKTELEKQAEERTNKLMSTVRQFRQTLDSLREGIQIIDFDWHFICK